jgi:hypothetical protein
MQRQDGARRVTAGKASAKAVTAEGLAKKI